MKSIDELIKEVEEKSKRCLDIKCPFLKNKFICSIDTSLCIKNHFKIRKQALIESKKIHDDEITKYESIILELKKEIKQLEEICKNDDTYIRLSQK